MIGLAEIARALRAAPERFTEQLGRARPSERGGLRHDRAVLHEAGLVDREVGDELHPVGVVVVHCESERAERDLARTGGLVPTDHVVHVVAHVVRRRVDVGAGNGDVVAAVELDVRVAEGAVG